MFGKRKFEMYSMATNKNKEIIDCPECKGILWMSHNSNIISCHNCSFSTTRSKLLEMKPIKDKRWWNYEKIN